MDLFNKVHIFEPMKSHIYELNISLISLISLMFDYAKPRIFVMRHEQHDTNMSPDDMKTGLHSEPGEIEQESIDREGNIA